MHTTQRLCIVLMPMEKTMVEQLAKVKGGLLPSSLRNVACQWEIRPPDKHRHIGHQIWGVQRV
jgi:hypothetical protein